MSENNKDGRQHGHDDHECKCSEDEVCVCGNDEIEIVELEDEDGGNEEFAILDEVNFEGRHFVVMAPLFEVKALKDSVEEQDEIDLSIEIYEVDGDYYTILDDDSLAKRLMQHLEDKSHEHGE